LILGLDVPAPRLAFYIGHQPHRRRYAEVGGEQRFLELLQRAVNGPGTGYRADVRGRTLPRFYGFRFSWLEVTAGLTFSWGER